MAEKMLFYEFPKVSERNFEIMQEAFVDAPKEVKFSRKAASLIGCSELIPVSMFWPDAPPHLAGRFVPWDLFTSLYTCRGYTFTKRNMPVPLKFSTALNRGLTKKEKQVETQKTLYRVIDTDEYGVILAKDSQGRVVIEIKGTGQIKAVEVDKLEEVLPYTVSVRYVSGNGGSYAFFAKPDEFKVGDLVVSSAYNSAMLVVKVDSKSKSAIKWLHGAIFRANAIIETR